MHARWDNKSQSWWTDGEDIPGLCCQAGTFEELTETVFELGPKLLRANGLIKRGADEVSLSVVAERNRTMPLVA